MYLKQNSYVCVLWIKLTGWGMTIKRVCKRVHTTQVISETGPEHVASCILEVSWLPDVYLGCIEQQNKLLPGSCAWKLITPLQTTPQPTEPSNNLLCRSMRPTYASGSHDVPPIFRKQSSQLLLTHMTSPTPQWHDSYMWSYTLDLKRLIHHHWMRKQQTHWPLTVIAPKQPLLPKKHWPPTAIAT